MLRSVVASLMLAFSFGCGAEEVGPPPDGGCELPRLWVDGQCVLPDEPPDACPPGNRVVEDGSCQAAGIGPDGCAAGFEHDGDVGCNPILPADPCGDGLMAVPGELSCREVMACGAGPWGDLPVDGNTVYVDASYAGVDGDGTASKPWHTIGEAYTAAAPGALIAVAEGQYVEDVVIIGKPVKLWGVCPSKVELVGTGVRPVTLLIQAPADGTEVGGLAITGPEIGLALTGSVDVVLDRLWVHDNGWRGINLQNTSGVVEAHISGVLVERAKDFGLFVAASDVQIEGVAVRDTLPLAGLGSSAAGMRFEPACPMGQMCNVDERAVVSLSQSVVEHNSNVGIGVLGSTAVITGTVIRDTIASAANSASGRGVMATMLCAANNVCDPAGRSILDLSGSLVEGNTELGIQVAGSDATIDTTVVRGTLPRPTLEDSGRGIAVQPPCDINGCDTSHRPRVTITSTLVEQNHQSGIFLAAADADVEGVVVRDTLPQLSDGWFGHGINIQPSCTTLGCDPTSATVADIVGSLFERNIESAITVASSSASIDGTLVRDTRARDGLLGDGLVVWSANAPAQGVLTHSRIEQSARAGVSNFGASVSIATTTIECAKLALAGEPLERLSFSYDDQGGNHCGCPDATVGCTVDSAGIEPPTPIGP